MIAHRLLLFIPLVVMSPWPPNVSGKPEPPVSPYRRDVIDRSVVAEWDFSTGTAAEGWVAHKDCTIEVAKGQLTIRATGNDSNVKLPPIDLAGPLGVTLLVRSAAPGAAVFFWATDDTGFSPERRVLFNIPRDGEWHEVIVPIDSNGPIKRLRFDPSTKSGKTDIGWLRVRRQELHPLEMEIDTRRDRVTARLFNHGPTPRTTQIGTSRKLIEPITYGSFVQKTPGKAAFESIELVVASDGLPPLRRRVWLHHAELPFDAIELRPEASNPDWPLRIDITRDGSGARIYRRKRLCAIMTPLVMTSRGEPIGPLEAIETSANRVVFRGPKIESLTVETTDAEIRIRIDASESCEGPVVRALGDLQQGLLAGVEYLGKHESSSSDLDIKTPEHIRFTPDPMDVTMPLMAYVTSKASVAMTWSDMTLQPVFATPNRFDGTTDHRMSLRGKRIDSTIRVVAKVGAGEFLEDAILWAVRRRGVPPVPEPPRTWEKQKRLCITAFDGPLRIGQLRTGSACRSNGVASFTPKPF